MILRGVSADKNLFLARAFDARVQESSEHSGANHNHQRYFEISHACTSVLAVVNTMFGSVLEQRPRFVLRPGGKPPLPAEGRSSPDVEDAPLLEQLDQRPLAPPRQQHRQVLSRARTAPSGI